MIVARAGLLVALALAVAAALAAPALWVAAVGVSTALYALLLAAVTRGSHRAQLQAAATEHAALHDPVTELPNRVLFHDRVHQAIARAQRDGHGLAVMMLDVDRFKEVNDTLGHHNGDLLLCEVGARLTATRARRATRSPGSAATSSPCCCRRRRRARDGRARCAPRSPSGVELAGVGVELEASVGIALYPRHGDDPEELLQRADVAMYAAKRRAQRRRGLQRRRSTTYSLDRLALVGDLRQAIDAGQLVLHYQPKVEPRRRARHRRRGARALGSPGSAGPHARTRSSRRRADRADAGAHVRTSSTPRLRSARAGARRARRSPSRSTSPRATCSTSRSRTSSPSCSTSTASPRRRSSSRSPRRRSWPTRRA